MKTPKPGDRVRFLRGDLKGQVGIWTLEKPGASVTLPSGTRVFNPGPVEIVTETVDLSTVEARNARQTELVKQAAAIARMPRDTTVEMVARFLAHADVDTAWVELYAAEADHQAGSSVAYAALMDASTARAQAAVEWRTRAEQLVARADKPSLREPRRWPLHSPEPQEDGLVVRSTHTGVRFRYRASWGSWVALLPEGDDREHTWYAMNHPLGRGAAELVEVLPEDGVR